LACTRWHAIEGRCDVKRCLRHLCLSATGAKAESRARLVAIIKKISSQPAPDNYTTCCISTFLHNGSCRSEKVQHSAYSLITAKMLTPTTGAIRSQRILTTPHGRNRKTTTATDSWLNQAGNPDNFLELKMRTIPNTIPQPTLPTFA
jgi:hypothetical protein